ncbi:MAG: TVP38/TMEM64 family protein [Pseudolabrys sp.]|nr:TVP38/TMEM64 family protein [Pseudolabrys sp.]MDP2297928.1 TVP38/TMEM64 family protein [Pseudolabrys sp.]
MTRRRWLLALIVVLAVAGGLALFWLFDGATSVDGVQTRIASLGDWAPVGFILLYAIATVAMIPGGIFDLAGGVLFGLVWGSLINLAGGTLGAALAFLVARYLAADWVERRAGPRMQKVIRSVETDGWQFVAFVRLVPIFPYNVVNYLLGVTRIPFHHYILATLVFMAPSTIAYTWIGHAGRAAVAGETDNIYYALIVLALVAILIMAPRFYRRLRRKPDGQD